MNRNIRFALLGSAVAAAALLAPAAQAATSVYVQVGPSPYYAPAYVAPRPAYVVTGPRYVVPPYHHGYRAYRHDQDRDGIPNRWDRDRDGDGVPNRWDRRPTNPWRR